MHFGYFFGKICFDHFWNFGINISKFFENMDLKRLLRGGWTVQPSPQAGSCLRRKWNGNGTNNGTGMKPKPPEMHIYFQFEAPMTLHLTTG